MTGSSGLSNESSPLDRQPDPARQRRNSPRLSQPARRRRASGPRDGRDLARCADLHLALPAGVDVSGVPQARHSALVPRSSAGRPGVSDAASALPARLQQFREARCGSRRLELQRLGPHGADNGRQLPRRLLLHARAVALRRRASGCVTRPSGGEAGHRCAASTGSARRPSRRPLHRDQRSGPASHQAAVRNRSAGRLSTCGRGSVSAERTRRAVARRFSAGCRTSGSISSSTPRRGPASASTSSGRGRRSRTCAAEPVRRWTSTAGSATATSRA